MFIMLPVEISCGLGLVLLSNVIKCFSPMERFGFFFFCFVFFIVVAKTDLKIQWSMTQLLDDIPG